MGKSGDHPVRWQGSGDRSGDIRSCDWKKVRKSRKIKWGQNQIITISLFRTQCWFCFPFLLPWTHRHRLTVSTTDHKSCPAPLYSAIVNKSLSSSPLCSLRNCNVCRVQFRATGRIASHNNNVMKAHKQLTYAQIPSSPLENKVFKLFFQQPATITTGKIVGIFPQFHCSHVNISVWFTLLTNDHPPRPGKIVGIIPQFHCSHGNVLFLESRRELTNHQPPRLGKTMGTFLQFHCSCGNISMWFALGAYKWSTTTTRQIMGIFLRFHCSHGNVLFLKSWLWAYKSPTTTTR